MEKEILRQIIDGDRDVYSRVYIEYYKKFYNYGKKFTADTLLIEDCIQEVFLFFWNKKEKLLNVESIESYFLSSFRNILFKNIKQVQKLISPGDDEPEPEFPIDQIIINKEMDQELHQKLQAALNSLTAHQRE